MALFTKILDFLFPRYCLHCRTELDLDFLLCKKCFGSIPLIKSYFCGGCTLPITTHREPCRSPCSTPLQPSCRPPCHPQNPLLLYAATDYHRPPIGALVHALKFDCMPQAADTLGAIICKYLENMRASSHAGFSTDFNDPLLVPIPLHHARMRERGFNQAELIAKYVAKTMGWEMACVLYRKTNTSPQSSLGRSERLKNLCGCFSVLDGAAQKNNMCGRNIILIDDVSTTGATFREAANAVLALYPASVTALAAAKA
ncbi:MAG: double zinc ribbon domain-containing protein [Candidatus Liptonbacteria bacterium]